MKNGLLFLFGFLLPSLSYCAGDQAENSLFEDQIVIQYFDFLNHPLPDKILVGQDLRLRFQVKLHIFGKRFCGFKWQLPAGVKMTPIVSGTCPLSIWLDSYPRAMSVFPPGWISCDFEAVIPTQVPGQVVSGSMGIIPYSAPIILNGCVHASGLIKSSSDLSVKVLPHPLSMLILPTQKAIANHPFYLDLKPFVLFYGENERAGAPVTGQVFPLAQDGLHFDPVHFVISGTPTRLGNYQFSVSASNQYGVTAPVNLMIQTGINATDTPVFKEEIIMLSAVSGETYQLNLQDLLKPGSSFMATNQIQFRIDTDKPYPLWLKIDENNRSILKGVIPTGSQDTEVSVTLIATSNTGGDSAPMTLLLKILPNPLLQPTIDYFELEKSVGERLSVDLSDEVTDPAQDNSIRLQLDKSEPSAPWLHLSQQNPMILEGVVPDNATGQIYQLTLRVNTLTGGSSRPVTIPLKIKTNDQFTPHFKADNPLLPMLYPGLPYFYDFVENRDIYPDFEDLPYQVVLDKDCENPAWLQVVDNRLIAEKVPEDLESDPSICIRIVNIPGGKSGSITLDFLLMR